MHCLEGLEEGQGIDRTSEINRLGAATGWGGSSVQRPGQRGAHLPEVVDGEADGDDGKDDDGRGILDVALGVPEGQGEGLEDVEGVQDLPTEDTGRMSGQPWGTLRAPTGAPPWSSCPSGEQQEQP